VIDDGPRIHRAILDEPHDNLHRLKYADWLEENEPRIAFNQMQTFMSHKKQKLSILDYDDEETPHEWWVGPTGTGKSRRLWELYPDHFQKKKNKWWCGYAGEDVVAIEEWSPANKLTADSLKEWADRYPFKGEVKHGTIHQIRHKKTIVISNYTIEQCFDEVDHAPMHRKFKVVHIGPTPKPTPWHESYNKP